MNERFLESADYAQDPVTAIVERYRNHPASSLETYQYFNQDKAVLDEYSRQVIDGDDMQAPQYTYDKLDADELVQIRDDLTAMLEDLPNDRQLTSEETLIRQSISMRLHETGILLLTKMQSDLDRSDPRHEAVSFQLGTNMREVYGLPDKQHFLGILGYRLNGLTAVEVEHDAPQAIKDAWSYIRQELPGDFPIEKPYQMKPETKDWYRRQLDIRLEPAITAVADAIVQDTIQFDESGYMNADAIVEATRLALAARGFNDWNVGTTKATGIDTRQSDKTIYIPESRSMRIDEFNRVIQAHEIDEHVARRVNGDASGVPILQGTGASGYLAYEEGNGKVNEALLSGSLNNEKSAFGYFLTAGLIAGLDRDDRGRNFRQTHDLVWRLNFIENYVRTHTYKETDVENRIREATKHVNRLFRGTDGTVPGVFFPKDSMTYYLGGVEVMKKWDEDMELPEEARLKEHRLERSAKIYPLDPAHRSLVQQVRQAHPYEVH